MNSTSISDRDRVLRVIKRKPSASVLEIMRAVHLPRRAIIYHVTQLLRDKAIRSIPLPARSGINEVRVGYEAVEVKIEAAPLTVKSVLPAQWDALSFLFGRAAVES